MRKKRNIIFTNKKNSTASIMSVILGGISLLSILYGMFSSFLLGGEIPARYGVAGALATLYAVVGLCMALFSLKDGDSFHLFGVLGTILNGCTLLFVVFVLWIPV